MAARIRPNVLQMQPYSPGKPVEEVKRELGLERVVKLGVFVASTPEFTDHPKVGNAASDLMVDVFGDAGRHARSAVGVAALPLGVPVEVDAIVALRP